MNLHRLPFSSSRLPQHFQYGLMHSKSLRLKNSSDMQWEPTENSRGGIGWSITTT